MFAINTELGLIAIVGSGSKILFYNLVTGEKLAIITIPFPAEKLQFDGEVCSFRAYQGLGSCGIDGTVVFREGVSEFHLLNATHRIEALNNRWCLVGPNERKELPDSLNLNTMCAAYLTTDNTALLVTYCYNAVILDFTTGDRTPIDTRRGGANCTFVPLIDGQFCTYSRASTNQLVTILSSSPPYGVNIQQFYGIEDIIFDPLTNFLIVQHTKRVEHRTQNIITAMRLDGTSVWSNSGRMHSIQKGIGAPWFVAVLGQLTYMLDCKTGQTMYSVNTRNGRWSHIGRWYSLGAKQLNRAIMFKLGEATQHVDLITSWSEDTFLQQTHKDGLRAFHHVAIVLPICKDLLGVVMQFHGRL
jgi:hypothetical protein